MLDDKNPFFPWSIRFSIFFFSSKMFFFSCSINSSVLVRNVSGITSKQVLTDGRTYGRTDIRTFGRTDGHTDGRTYPLIEMRGRKKKKNKMRSFSCAPCQKVYPPPLRRFDSKAALKNKDKKSKTLQMMDFFPIFLPANI